MGLGTLRLSLLTVTTVASSTLHSPVERSLTVPPGLGRITRKELTRQWGSLSVKEKMYKSDGDGSRNYRILRPPVRLGLTRKRKRKESKYLTDNSHP